MLSFFFRGGQLYAPITKIKRKEKASATNCVLAAFGNRGARERAKRQRPRRAKANQNTRAETRRQLTQPCWPYEPTSKEKKTRGAYEATRSWETQTRRHKSSRQQDVAPRAPTPQKRARIKIKKGKPELSCA